MTTHRLFVAKHFDLHEDISLDPSQAHYLLRVVRLPEGATLNVFNGKQGEWRAKIVNIKKNSCDIRLLEKVRDQTAAQDIHYAFAPLKQARLDYLIQKAVEMGVSSLMPVITAHTAVGRVNLARMYANAIEAAEQCGILTLPDIHNPVKLESFLEACAPDRVVVFCDERAGLTSPLSALEPLRGSKVTALIGPEGGFSQEERALLLSKTFVRPLWLGPRIMRADTAAVSVLALINAVLGDWRE